MRKQLRGSAYLLLATFIWGTTFIAQSVGMDHIGPITFLAVRNALAVPFLMLLAFLFDRKKSDYWKLWKDKKLWLAGISCGLALFVAAALQQIGIVHREDGDVFQRLGVVLDLALLAGDEERFVLRGKAVGEDAVDKGGLSAVQKACQHIDREDLATISHAYTSKRA
jgi:hypothetical protein